MILLSRMVVVALVIGTAVTASATERVDASLVLSGLLGWSIVPVVQLLTGLLLVAGTPTVQLVKALERYFATHWPWSLWILATHGAWLLAPPLRGLRLWVLLTAVVPVVVTVRLLLTFCRDALGMPEAVARRRVALHQVVTGSIAFVCLAILVALWPRIVGLLS